MGRDPNLTCYFVLRCISWYSTIQYLMASPMHDGSWREDRYLKKKYHEALYFVYSK